MIQSFHFRVKTPKLTVDTKTDICAPMFSAALFTTAKRWKQLKCPLTDKWRHNMWHKHTMEHYSPLKKEGNSDTRDNMNEP